MMKSSPSESRPDPILAHPHDGAGIAKEAADRSAGVLETRRLASFAAGIVVASVAVGCLIGTGALDGHDQSDSHASSPNVVASDRPVLPIKEGEPCFAAKKASVSGLAATARVPMWMPRQKSVGLTGAWTCGGDTPLLEYGDVDVTYEDGWGGVDIAQKWADLVTEYGGSVQDINGISAYVEPVANGSTRPQVMLVRDDTLVRLLGAPKTDIDQLVKIASSIDFGLPLTQ